MKLKRQFALHFRKKKNQVIDKRPEEFSGNPTGGGGASNPGFGEQGGPNKPIDLTQTDMAGGASVGPAATVNGEAAACGVVIDRSKVRNLP